MSTSVSAYTSLYEAASQLGDHDASTRIVGSIARSAVIGEVLPDIRENGTRRNFNALHMMPNNYQQYGSGRLMYAGHSLSTRFDQWIRTESNGTTWLVYPAHPERLSIEVTEPEETFQRYSIPVGEVCITTVPPEVLGKINRLMAAERPKDRGNFTTYDAAIADRPQCIHPELLEPFDDFMRYMAQERAYRAKVKLRNELYYRFVPEELRVRFEVSRYLGRLATAPYVQPIEINDDGAATN